MKKEWQSELLKDIILNTSIEMSQREFSLKILKAVSRHTPYSLFGIFIYNDKEHMLKRIMAIGKNHNKVVQFNDEYNLKESEGVVGRAFRSQSVQISHIMHDKDYKNPHPVETEYKGEYCMALPIIYNKKPYGVFYIENRHEFTEEEKTTLGAMMSVIARIFANRILSEKVEFARKENESIIEAISEPIFIIDNNYTIKRVNRSFLDEFQMKKEQVIGKKCYEIVEKSRKPPLNCPLANLLSGKKMASGEISVSKKQYSAVVYGLKQEENQTVYVHTLKDISKLREKEYALNLLYDTSLKLSASKNIEEFKKVVEKVLETENSLIVSVFWRNNFKGKYRYYNHTTHPNTVRKGATTEGEFISANFLKIPIIYLGEEVGEFVVQNPLNRPIPASKIRFYETLAHTVSTSIQNLYLMEGLKGALTSLNRNYKETLESLSHALDYREQETEFHSRRVASYALLIAKKMGLTEVELKNLYWGGLMHDIGKIGIPDAILLKPAKLTEEEWAVMKKHPLIGYDILKDIEFLKEATKVVLYHHERWDGHGYPEGLQDTEIPLIARVFAISDTYDAITSDRPYRKALSAEYAFSEIEKNNGKQFDPNIGSVFLSKISYKELAEVRRRVSTDPTYSPI